MGWFFINLVIPATLPLALLVLLKAVDMPEPYASRAKVLRAVRDGQLGWVAMGSSASCTYDLLGFVFGAKAVAPDWTGLVLTLAVSFLAFSGVLCMAGTLFPFDETKRQPRNWREWLLHYKLFSVTALSTVITASLYGLVHYGLPTSQL